MYHIIFYINGDCEKYSGLFIIYPCSVVSIKMIVEYNDNKIINCFNPNDVWVMKLLFYGNLKDWTKIEYL
jgi:hypothetical protein